MPDAPGRGLSQAAPASSLDSSWSVQSGQDHTAAAQKQRAGAELSGRGSERAGEQQLYAGPTCRSGISGSSIGDATIGSTSFATCDRASSSSAAAGSTSAVHAGHIGRWKPAAGERARQPAALPASGDGWSSTRARSGASLAGGVCFGVDECAAYTIPHVPPPN